MVITKKDKSNSSIRKHIDFIIMDIVLLELSYFLATLWYHAAFNTDLVFGMLYKQQSLILFVCFIASITVGQPYKNILKRDKWLEISYTLKHAAKMAMLDVALMYIMKEMTTTSRLTFFVTWIFYIMLEILFRLCWKRIIRNHFIKHNDSRRQIVVLTDKKHMSVVENDLDIYLLRDFDITAVFLIDYNKETDCNIILSHARVLGGTDEIVDYTIHNWVDEVILDIHDNRELAKKMENVFDAMGIITHHLITVLEDDTDESSINVAYVERMGNCIVLTRKAREVAPIQNTMKRVLDIFGGLIGSLFAIIIIIVVGPIIRKKSPGPIIFSQERVGKNGKIFRMYKIRSMYLDAEERKAELIKDNKMDGFMFKIDDDPRIIGSENKDKYGKPKGIGNFIRTTSLDEFPQFFNVLKGDMSLVGTRPPTLDEWDKYSLQHRKRLSIKPGITGLWQISGRSKVTDFNEVVKLDKEYVDTWTVGMDIKILLKTIVKVIKKEGAE